jgi:hypothetical protein
MNQQPRDTGRIGFNPAQRIAFREGWSVRECFNVGQTGDCHVVQDTFNRSRKANRLTMRVLACLVEKNHAIAPQRPESERRQNQRGQKDERPQQSPPEART